MFFVYPHGGANGRWGRRISAIALAVSVTIGLTTPSTSSAGDVSYFGVAKGLLFTQTNGNAPVLRSGLPFVFQAIVQPPTNRILSARVQWSVADLALSPITTPSALGFIQRVRTQETLDGTFPSGAYRIAVQTVSEGSRTGIVSVLGNEYPAPPALQNQLSVVGVNASAPFQLRWNPFIGAISTDFIFVQIENSNGRVFSTGPYPEAPGALQGTSTSVVIPANTLQPGRAYAVRIQFHRFSFVSRGDLPGAIGTGGYFTQTDFYLTTASAGGGDISAPRVVSTEPADGATGVPVNTPVVFRFSEPMNLGLALGIAGTTAPRTFSWSPDGQTLVITPVTNWPPNTTILWTLNPFYAQLAFGDTAGNPLPMETVTGFTTGSSTVASARPILRNIRKLPTGRVQFTVAGQPERSYLVQGSTNFTQWTSLGTNIAFNGEFDFIDTNAPALPRRFYRALGR